MSDHNAALYEIMTNLDRLINIVEGVSLKKDLPDREAILVAGDALAHAKKMILLGLIGEEVAH